MFKFFKDFIQDIRYCIATYSKPFKNYINLTKLSFKLYIIFTSKIQIIFKCITRIQQQCRERNINYKNYRFQRHRYFPQHIANRLKYYEERTLGRPSQLYTSLTMYTVQSVYIVQRAEST